MRAHDKIYNITKITTPIRKIQSVISQIWVISRPDSTEEGLMPYVPNLLNDSTVQSGTYWHDFTPR